MKKVGNHSFRCIPQILTHCTFIITELDTSARCPHEETGLRVGDQDLGLGRVSRFGFGSWRRKMNEKADMPQGPAERSRAWEGPRHSDHSVHSTPASLLLGSVGSLDFPTQRTAHWSSPFRYVTGLSNVPSPKPKPLIPSPSSAPRVKNYQGKPGWHKGACRDLGCEYYLPLQGRPSVQEVNCSLLHRQTNAPSDICWKRSSGHFPS